MSCELTESNRIELTQKRADVNPSGATPDSRESLNARRGSGSSASFLAWLPKTDFSRATRNITVPPVWQLVATNPV